MINIRYHIVSITAVFLALGIGVALGSTFLDRATVNVLDRNITSAENRIKASNAENDRLNKQLDQAKDRDNSLIIVGSESLVANQLTDVPVLAIAAPGVDKADIEVVRTILERSGSDFRGTVALSDKLAFTDPDGGLARDLGVTNPTATSLRAAGTSAITDALAAAGTPLKADGESPGGKGATTTTTVPGAVATTTVAPPASTTTTTAANGSKSGSADLPDGKQPTAITALLNRGYLKLTPGQGYDSTDPILETTGYRYVYIGGPNLTASQNDVLLSILPSTGDALPTTVVSASQPDPVADEIVVPTVVARIRANDALVKRYNTVDNTETFAGLSAMLFTLRDMGTVDPGQYGQAKGATAILPPPS
ncbi:copper transporter [Aquihabitans sp. McL0605]|uniref:copper transporter n=1 Tax=Aquihabitans sp. McL0605 TaxID=3415671 RepID=UPI003CF65C37